MKIEDLPIEVQEKIKTLEFNPIPAKKDITGNVYQRLTVLGRGKDYVSPGGHKNSQWWCVCDCPEHNILLVRISNLTSGNTKSCGCLDKEKSTERIKAIGHSMAKDITNQTFGELTAIKPTGEVKNGSIVWECRCSCGRTHYVTGTELRAKRITSCGCKKYESKCVRKIKKVLDENNIPYVIEKTFSNFRFPNTNGIPRFDFYINNNFLLEYDGEQHYKETSDGYFKDNLEARQLRDEYKNQWCKDNGIPLKRIPYMDENNISLELIMGDKYLI